MASFTSLQSCAPSFASETIHCHAVGVSKNAATLNKHDVRILFENFPYRRFASRASLTRAQSCQTGSQIKPFPFTVTGLAREARRHANVSCQSVSGAFLLCCEHEMEAEYSSACIALKALFPSHVTSRAGRHAQPRPRRADGDAPTIVDRRALLIEGKFRTRPTRPLHALSGGGPRQDGRLRDLGF